MSLLSAHSQENARPAGAFGVLRSVLTLCAWTALIAAAVLFAAAAIGRVYGYHMLTVMSGSMEPRLQTGDVIVGRVISAARAHPGDVISFRDPTRSGRLLTHRVMSKRVVGTNFKFVTKGDANTGVERWEVPVDGSLGRVSFRIEKLGYVLAWLRGPLARIAFLAFPALALGGFVVARIWRPSPSAGALPSRL